MVALSFGIRLLKCIPKVKWNSDRRNRTNAGYALVIVGAWILYLVLLGGLQKINAGIGLNVWPLYEDHNFLSMMQNRPGSNFQKAFWLIDGRNPLNPWWYASVRPLMTASHGYGFFVVRRLMDLACALSVFLLLQRLGRGQHPTYSLVCALLTLIWQFSPLYGSIIWDRLGALSLTLVCLWSYCKYVDEGRRRGHFLAISLLLYFFTIGTYTLQSSAFLSIFVIGVFRTPTDKRNPSSWAKRVGVALLETSYFVAMLAGVMMIWITCTPLPSPDDVLTWSLVSKTVIPCLLKTLWHPSYTTLCIDIWKMWSPWTLFAAFTFSLTCWGLALRPMTRRPTSNAEPTNPSAEQRTSLGSVIGYTAAVVTGLAAMTMSVEITSATYPPGTRTSMIQQILHPLMYVAVLFGLTARWRRFPATARYIRWGSLSLLFGMATIFCLEHNRVVNRFTTLQQKKLLDSVRQVAPLVDQPTNLIVLWMDPSPERINPLLAHHYVQKHCGSSFVNPVFIFPTHRLASYIGYDPVCFLDDDSGVTMIDAQGVKRTISFKDVVVIRYDGTSSTVLQSLSVADIVGLDAYFKRDNMVIDLSQNPLTEVLSEGLLALTKPMPQVLK